MPQEKSLSSEELGLKLQSNWGAQHQTRGSVCVFPCFCQAEKKGLGRG